MIFLINIGILNNYITFIKIIIIKNIIFKILKTIFENIEDITLIQIIIKIVKKTKFNYLLEKAILSKIFTKN